MGEFPIRSGDAYAIQEDDGAAWRIGTTLIERRIALTEGRLTCTHLTNKTTSTNLVQRTGSDEFLLVIDDAQVAGASGGYELVQAEAGELSVPKASPGIAPGVWLELTLAREDVALTLRYEIPASTPRTHLGMIHTQWRIANRSGHTLHVSDVRMHHLRLRRDLIPRLTLYAWQGGGAGPGTNQLLVDPPGQRPNRTLCSWAGQPNYRADDVFDGSSSYHPYMVLEDGPNAEGLYLGIRYLGPWEARFWQAQYGGEHGARRDECYLASIGLAKHVEHVAPHATFVAPAAFVGVYAGDLDDAAEQLHDWQATFKWDYTNEDYLWRGAIWNRHWNHPDHHCDTERRRDDMWRVANLCRTTGVGIAHEDDFWFDERGRGVWEGVDWRGLVEYLGESGIRFRLWMPPQHFDPGTPVDVEHPEWQPQSVEPRPITSWYGKGFCNACPEAIEHMKALMIERQERYGAFQHRLDGWVQSPCYAKDHAHPPGYPFLQQYRMYLRMLREVREACPEMGLQGCNSGGEWCDWDKLELLDQNQSSDGGGPDDPYYLSYFWSAAKFLGGGGGAHHEDAAWIERVRAQVVLQRYFRAKGVVGRYARFYHPRAEGAPDAHTFRQVMNADRTRGYLQQDSPCEGEVVVYPKRLVPELSYAVTWLHADEPLLATGAQLMAEGIRYDGTDAGEMVFLNLGDHPGAGTDTEPPTTPKLLSAEWAEYWGHRGVALRWTESHDNGLVAGYRVLRDGAEIGYVGIGTFYLDESDGADPKADYAIVAVDGDGNQSALSTRG
jgi:hypothetical protein